MDVENETAIQEALSRLIKNKTVLIIAHWMRTVASADQVVVLSGGIVVEQGSPAELYARKGLYTHTGYGCCLCIQDADCNKNGKVACCQATLPFCAM